MSGLRSFLAELKRRKVYRVAALYAVVGLGVIEAADLILPRLQLPDSATTLVLALVLLGFPIALVLAWALEITPDGVKREEEGARIQSGGIMPFLGTLGLLGIVIGAGWWLRSGSVEIASGPSGEREKPAIAVLPFDNLSPDPENAFFAAGMHEEIISQLSKISSLIVISRSSVMGYATDRPSLPQIASELGVDFVLEGSARRAEDRVRLTTQLIDGRTDEHMWTENYDRDLSVEELFDIQDDVAGRVAQSLSATILPAEEERLAEPPTDNLDAFDHYLRGNEHAARRSTLSEAQMAIEMYERAVRLDPEFALAHAGVGRIRIWLSWNWGIPGEYARAKSAIDRAVELAPNAAGVRISRGYFHYHGARDYDLALEDLEFALLQEPSSADALLAVGAIHRRRGQWDESLAVMGEAVKRNPRGLSVRYNIGQTAAESGRYELAERHFSEAIAIAPSSYVAWRERAWLRVRVAGRTEGGWEAVEQAAARQVPMFPERFWFALLDRDFDRAGGVVADWVPIEGDGAFAEVGAAELAFLTGRSDEATRWAETARALLEPAVAAWPEGLARDGYWQHGQLGLVHAILGNRELALEYGEEGVRLLPLALDAHNAPSMLWFLARIHVVLGDDDDAVDLLETIASNPRRLNVPPIHLDPMWDPLRDDPAFQALLDEDGG
ncbi:MAG: tetratricopeptide repeat protein [Longimicrobiales bacterium]